MANKTRRPLPPHLAEALTQFGAGLRALRLRRRIPIDYAAQVASISRSTLHKMERGDPGVGLGSYAAVLHYYGMLGRLEDLPDPRYDRGGLALERSRLPLRIRKPGPA